MNHAHANRVGDVDDIALGIVAPDGREGMRAHVQQMSSRGHSVHLRSGTGAAAVFRRRAARNDRCCQVSRGQRLRGAVAQRADGPFAARSRGAGGCPDRHAGRRRLAHLHRRFRPRCAQRQAGGARRPHRMRRRVPRRACCTASRTAGIGSAQAGSRRSWARSRSLRAAVRITSSTATGWRHATPSASAARFGSEGRVVPEMLMSRSGVKSGERSAARTPMPLRLYRYVRVSATRLPGRRNDRVRVSADRFAEAPRAHPALEPQASATDANRSEGTRTAGGRPAGQPADRRQSHLLAGYLRPEHGGAGPLHRQGRAAKAGRWSAS